VTKLFVSEQFVTDTPGATAEGADPSAPAPNNECYESFHDLTTLLHTMGKYGVYYVCVKCDTATLSAKTIEGPSLSLAVFVSILGLPLGPVLTGRVGADGSIMEVGDIDLKLVSFEKSSAAWIAQGNVPLFICPAATDALEADIRVEQPGPGKTELTKLLGVIRLASTLSSLDIINARSKTFQSLRAVYDVGGAVAQYTGSTFFRATNTDKIHKKGADSGFYSDRFKAMLTWISMPGPAKTQALAWYGAETDQGAVYLPMVTYGEAMELVKWAVQNYPQAQPIHNALLLLANVFGSRDDTPPEGMQMKVNTKQNKELLDSIALVKSKFTSGEVQLENNKGEWIAASDLQKGQKIKWSDFKHRVIRIVVGVTGKGANTTNVTKDVLEFTSVRPNQAKVPSSKKADKAIDFTKLNPLNPPATSNEPPTIAGTKRARI